MNNQTAWRFAQVICFVFVAMLTVEVTTVDARAIASVPSLRVTRVAQPVDPSVVRGALREANTALDAAVKSGNWKNLLKAVDDANSTINNISDLNAAVVKQDLTATLKRFYAAQGLLFTLLKDSCPRRVEHGLVTAQFLRALNPTQRAGIGSATIKAVEKGLEACLRFDLLVSSRITNAELKYEIQVDITVPLRWNLNNGFLTGSGPIKKIAQSMKPKGSCTVTLTYTPVPFEVTRMTMNADINPSSYEAFVEEIKLSDYTPGPVNESMTTTCPKTKPGSFTGAFLNWGLNFSALHAFNDNIVIEDWTLGKPSGAVGSKKYMQRGPDALLLEDSDFILVHKPAK